jgi:DNA-damage-inducible protein J
MAQISLRVDDEVKRNAEKTLETIGLSMSAAINIFLKTVARENRIPFELSADPFYLGNNIHYLDDMPPESCASFKVSNQLVY